MINYIYCYTNKINDKKYVGLTNNYFRRLKEHKSSSFNPKSTCYDLIIHLAIRKYGLDNFNIEILEKLKNQSQEEVNEAEGKWIKTKKSLVSQHGYNVLEMGRGAWKSFLTPDIIKEIKTMITQGSPYDLIVEKYAISKSFISAINTGYYFFDDKVTYPLYAYRINHDIYDSLIEDLVKPELTLKELSQKYNLGESTVKKFNYGTLLPGYYKGTYPIRKITPTDYKAEIIIDKLLNTDLSKKEIAILSKCSDETVRKINLGLTHKKNYLTYPLR